MNIHEYQAKKLLKHYSINIPKGFIVTDAKQLDNIFFEKDKSYIAKVQIHAGARNKAGGVQKISTKQEAIGFCQKFLGRRIVTPQTPKGGKVVSAIYIEEALNGNQELYLSIFADKNKQCNIALASKEGGIDIQDAFKKSTSNIVCIDPLLGFAQFYAKKALCAFNFKKEQANKFITLLSNLFRLYKDIDAELVEINPLIDTGYDFFALDAKIVIDDNALFRQDEVLSYRDILQEEPLEYQASQNNLNYVKLDGNIAMVVNGAGLAMACLDTIEDYGGKCANFLDIKGSATKESIIKALEIIYQDSRVKVVFVNIIGGIVRCDIVANALLDFCDTYNFSLPIVARLEGANKNEAIDMLSTFKKGNIAIVKTLKEGIEKVILSAGEKL
ncbi:Succinyl-CoA ligase [ADP-forming] beta chain [Desulfurella amilsii]|uniref:Succinyl-CoA ligase [ADP-forming] beta chain n=1 Tax=Desulfurella amilsii TaxID=1562698 RepID=A0A1X4XUZ7_9BACT|nr:ADP-forming succinate--CoA ligase subunit beta [Desulfurella amilsii]OSS41355.1 Succinyl-CoA ligase [ADP-forming] beta chain [Desulfurella amilsii]